MPANQGNSAKAIDEIRFIIVYVDGGGAERLINNGRIVADRRRPCVSRMARRRRTPAVKVSNSHGALAWGRARGVEPEFARSGKEHA
jgi:hypothetical protein